MYRKAQQDEASTVCLIPVSLHNFDLSAPYHIPLSISEIEAEEPREVAAFDSG